MTAQPALPWWQDLTPRQIARLADEDGVAILPLAAIEQHGEHLPLSTDLDIALGLLQAALPKLRPGLPVCVLPPLAVGLSLEHCAFAGTLSLSPETALATLVELGDSVARAGFRRLVLFNSHGGNKAVLDLAALKLRVAYRMLVVRANYFRFAPPPDALPAAELRHGLHGGALETAMMLHLAPHTVHMQHARDFRSTSQDRAEQYAILGNGKSAKLGWQMQDYHPAGAVGNAAAATADKGRAVVQAAGQQLAQLLGELHALPLATLNMTL